MSYFIISDNCHNVRVRTCAALITLTCLCSITAICNGSINDILADKLYSFSYFCSKCRFGVLVRTALIGQLYQTSTIYILAQKKNNNNNNQLVYQGYRTPLFLYLYNHFLLFILSNWDNLIACIILIQICLCSTQIKIRNNSGIVLQSRNYHFVGNSGIGTVQF